ncbi:glucose PTS transporter subunit EIIB [Brachyspira intermedia]
MVIANIVIGLIFTGIWFVVFRFLILKFNIPTPGRGDSKTKLYTKKDYKEREAKKSSFDEQAAIYLEALGGRNNIEHVTNCATRLRVTVKDVNLVKDVDAFKEGGAHGLVKKGNAIQIIVGLSVPQVKAKFEELLKTSE